MGEAGPETERAEETPAESLGEVIGTVELTEADYVDAYLGYAAQKQQIVGPRRFIAIVLGVSLLIVAYFWPVVPGVWTAMVALWAAGLYLVRYQWVWIGKRAFALLHPARRRYEMRFDERGHVSTGPRARVKHSFRAFSGWMEIPTHLLLLAPVGIAVLVPKRAFDDAQLARLRAIFAASIVAPAPAAAPSRKGRLSSNLKTLLLWLALVVGMVVIYELVRAPT